MTNTKKHMKTYYGTKIKMTQAWTNSGLRLPVTIIKVDPMVVTQRKTVEVDGYDALQVGMGNRRPKTVSKSQVKHMEKSGVIPLTVKEIRESTAEEIAVGSKISVGDVLTLGDMVMVTSASKGQGFGGVMKRWGFKGGPKTHGQSDRWRAPGSIGQGTSPGRIHKGKKMAGRFGNATFTIKNLQVIKIDDSLNQVWINGPIPGGRNCTVEIVVASKGKFDGLFSESKE
jgi:large subunit ribosomal protein L3